MRPSRARPFAPNALGISQWRNGMVWAPLSGGHVLPNQDSTSTKSVGMWTPAGWTARQHGSCVMPARAFCCFFSSDRSDFSSGLIFFSTSARRESLFNLATASDR